MIDDHWASEMSTDAMASLGSSTVAGSPFPFSSDFVDLENGLASTMAMVRVSSGANITSTPFTGSADATSEIGLGAAYPRAVA